MFTNNEKGVTLIEIIASIAIISIMLVTVMNFFPQMAKVNQLNIKKNQGVNLVKNELLYWQNTLERELQLDPTNVKTPIAQCPESLDQYCGIFELQTESETDFQVIVRVSKQSDLTNGAINAHLIQIEIVKSEDHSPVSETYGYIFLSEDGS